MTGVCIALLVILAIIVIWRVRSCPCSRADSMVAPPSAITAQIRRACAMPAPTAIIKAPFLGPPLGPQKVVAQSDLEVAPDDNATSGRFKYVGIGGMSCPNKRWYDSVYNGGIATEIDAPGIAARDIEDPDLMVMGIPPDPDAVRAFPEHGPQRNLLAGETLP